MPGFSSEDQTLTLPHPCHGDSAEVFTVDQRAMLAFYLVGIVWFLSRYVSEGKQGTDDSCAWVGMHPSIHLCTFVSEHSKASLSGSVWGVRQLRMEDP